MSIGVSHLSLSSVCCIRVYNIHSCPGSIVVCEDETYYYCLEASPSQRFASSAIILLVRLVYKCKIMSGLLELRAFLEKSKSNLSLIEF